jgi:hypothetical protein
MDEPSQQEAGPSTSKREQREQRRQIELQGQKELTYEEISEGSNIPIKVWTRAVSLVYWDDPEFDITRDLNASELTTYFAHRMMEIIWLDLKGRVLGQSLVEDFTGWTPRHFSLVNRTFMKEMIAILEDRVWI